MVHSEEVGKETEERRKKEWRVSAVAHQEEIKEARMENTRKGWRVSAVGHQEEKKEARMGRTRGVSPVSLQRVFPPFYPFPHPVDSLIP